VLPYGRVAETEVIAVHQAIAKTLPITMVVPKDGQILELAIFVPAPVVATRIQKHVK
jgi:hypothetical protein